MIGIVAGTLLAAWIAAAQEPRPNPQPPTGVRGEREPGKVPPRRGENRPGAEVRSEAGRPGQPPLRGGEGRVPGRPEAEGVDGRPLNPDGRGPAFSRPGEGRRPMGPLGPGMMPGQDLRRMQQEDPEMYDLLVADDELDRQALEKAEQVRRATTDDRERLKAELADVVGKHFEARQKRRELQLKRMEEEIQRLREAIKARNDAREDIVNKRITELTGDANPLDF
jgi:hypothetical protein